MKKAKNFERLWVLILMTLVPWLFIFLMALGFTMLADSSITTTP